MKVKFTQPFFGATRPYKRKGGDIIEGKLYTVGIHDCPDDIVLPPSAEIIKDEPDIPEPVKESDLPSFTHPVEGVNARIDNYQETIAKAEEQLNKNKKAKS